MIWLSQVGQLYKGNLLFTDQLMQLVIANFALACGWRDSKNKECKFVPQYFCDSEYFFPEKAGT